MPVAPDLLLTPAATTKPKALSANTSQSAAQPRKQDDYSFSQVYAKERQAQHTEPQAKSAGRQSQPAERQAKPVERQANSAGRPDNTAKAAGDGKTDTQTTDNASASTVTAESVIADSGKDLPDEPMLEEDVVDPLMLLGLFQAAPQIEMVDEQPETAPAVTLSPSLIGSASATTAQADLDLEIDAFNQQPALQLSLEVGAQESAAAQSTATPNGAATSASASAGQTFASAMAAMGMKAGATEGESTESTPLMSSELSAEGLEALKESSADTAPEQFVSKLNALSQVIGQQASQVGRVPVVPGQPVAMQQTGWSEGVVDKVMWMSSQNLKSAEIQLDPAELGRLDVRISLTQDQTQISFASAHPGVREALEGQVNRLREMFTQQGMNLADVNVSDQSQGRAWQGQEGDGRGRGSRMTDEGGLGESEERVVGSVEIRDPALGTGRGMVDYYA